MLRGKSNAMKSLHGERTGGLSSPDSMLTSPSQFIQGHISDPLYPLPGLTDEPSTAQPMVVEEPPDHSMGEGLKNNVPAKQTDSIQE